MRFDAAAATAGDSGEKLLEEGEALVREEEDISSRASSSRAYVRKLYLVFVYKIPSINSISYAHIPSENGCES